LSFGFAEPSLVTRVVGLDPYPTSVCRICNEWKEFRAGIANFFGSKIIHKELPQDDPTRRRPDISRAQKCLGWNPTLPLDKGLQSTIAYFQDQQKRVPLDTNANL